MPHIRVIARAVAIDGKAAELKALLRQMILSFPTLKDESFGYLSYDF